jgi:hypothetical protein
VPEYETALNQTLSRFAEKTWIEPADMYFVVDFAKVIQAYLELKRPNGRGTLEPFCCAGGQPVTATVTTQA